VIRAPRVELPDGVIKLDKRPAPPWRVRCAIEEIGFYFRREGHFDFPPYSTAPGEHYPIVLWVDDGQATGAAGFINDPQWKRWIMTWVWLHPYHRHQGVLTDAWPMILREFPDMAVEGPLSRAMRAFLQKHNWDFEHNRPPAVVPSASKRRKN
jgi:hypothetical protein